MALSSPPHPFIGLLGGAKVSDKIEVVNSLLEKVDKLLIGGGMAYTFLRAKGLETGKSLVEEDKIDLAREILERAPATSSCSPRSRRRRSFRRKRRERPFPSTKSPKDGWDSTSDRRP